MIIMDDHICYISPGFCQTNMFYYIWRTSFVTRWSLENNNSYLEIALHHFAISSTFLSPQPDYDEPSEMEAVWSRTPPAARGPGPDSDWLTDWWRETDVSQQVRFPAENFTVIQHEVLRSNWGSVRPDKHTQLKCSDWNCSHSFIFFIWKLVRASSGIESLDVGQTRQKQEACGCKWGGK